MDRMVIIIESALSMAERTSSDYLFLFLETDESLKEFSRISTDLRRKIVLVVPSSAKVDERKVGKGCAGVLKSWSGNQSRFSRVKYAFMQAVLQKIISPDDRIVCALGPSGKSHLDTVTIHDLSLSWSEEFPFDVKQLIGSGHFQTIMAVIDIALDIGALGREGKSVGTIFVIGDSETVLESSNQAIFNPFRGYAKSERMITRPEVVESLKEVAKLDGAIVISAEGMVEAAGRHLETGGAAGRRLRGLGARHRAAAGITLKADAVSVVVSESTGKVTVFSKGKMVATLEPVISRRLM
ncbi:MAG TPA: DNA integrity scanning protein DisA nucleotide-binding domain protein [Spirochaetota bacterium]|nr:DNA integrity scanning protein DisA nucleotide-binding domain protein [Spirochaetota bacterium]